MRASLTASDAPSSTASPMTFPSRQIREVQPSYSAASYAPTKVQPVASSPSRISASASQNESG